MKKSESSIKCKSCRQYIPSHKVFLHEGFCQRNNIFCEHCEQVFLRKDYDKHILDISKNLTNTNKESIIKRLNTDFQEFKSDISDNSIKINKVKKKRTKIPIIEEYSIRKPIIIEPNGKIIYDKNNNNCLSEFDLDYIKRNIRKQFKNNIILNAKFNYAARKNLVNFNNINYYNNRRIEKTNNTNYSNILYNNNIFNDKNSILIVDKFKEKKNNLKINIINNNYFENKIDSIRLGNDITNFYINNTRPKSNDIHLNTTEAKKKNISEKIQNNKSNIIINNQIITYNSNSNVNEIVNNNKTKNVYDKSDDDNINISKNNVKKISKYNTKTNVYYGRFNKHKENKITNNLEKHSTKEPLDSVSKDKYKIINRNKKELKPENSIKNKSKYFILEKGNNNKSRNMSKCQLCNVLTDNLSIHNKICKKKVEIKNKKIFLIKNKNNLNPKKVQTLKLELNNKMEDIDTSSTDDKNILLIKNINPTLMTKYNEKVSLKQALLQRGNSQDIIFHRRKKKKEATKNTSNTSTMQDVNGFPEDTKINTEILPFPKDSKRKFIYIIDNSKNKKFL